MKTICPKCKSEKIEVCERGYKLRRAIVTGIVFTPIVGAAIGALGMKKFVNRCQDCGEIFKFKKKGKNA